MTGRDRCGACGRPIHYSGSDVGYMHDHNGSYWCDSVRYDVKQGYVDANGEHVKSDRNAHANWENER